MRDRAVVVSVDNHQARVRVSPQIACEKCAARSLCLGRQDQAGQITVDNPVQARPGDEVEIEVPESRYEKEMVRIFGLLLAASLTGLAAGWILHPVSALGPNGNGLVGLALGLGLSGLALFRYYQKQRKKVRFPVIVEILNRGGLYGQT